MNWSVLNPWLLAFTLFALVPIWFYLFRKRNPQQVSWAAMQFLEQAKPLAKRKRWNRWLLLAVRTLLPILLALIVATPSCQNSNIQSARDSFRVKHVVMIFDTSASMGPWVDGQSHLQEAKRKAQQTIRSAASGTQFSVIASSTITQWLLRSSVDQQVVERTIESLSIDAGSFDVAQAGQQCLQAVESVRQALTNTEIESEVLIYSDFSKSDFTTSAWQAAAFDSIRNSASVRLVSCRAVDSVERRSNIGIVDIQTDSRKVAVGSPVEVQVTLAGNYPVSDSVRVELVVNGQLVDRQTCSEFESGRSQCRFTLRPDQVGDLRIQARIDRHGWLSDDQAFTIVQVTNAVSVLCVCENLQAAQPIVAATESQPSSDGRLPAISTVTTTADRWGELNWSSADVIVMLDLRSINSDDSQKLAEFVGQGGAVLVSLASSANTESWSQFFETISEGSVRYTGVSDFSNKQVDPKDYQHPIVREFQDQPGSGLLSTPIRRYHQFETDAGNVEGVFDLDEGRPGLFVFKVGSGRIAVSTTPWSVETDAGQSWNDLPAWWSYVPIVNNTLAWLHNESGLSQVFRAGQIATLRFDEASARAELSDANSQNTTSRVTDGQGRLRFTWPRTGFVDVTLVDEAVNRGQAVAFNLSRQELDAFQAADLSQLRNQLATITSDSVQQLSNESKPELNGRRRSQKFYVVALLALLLLLVVEPLLADRKSAATVAAERRGPV